MAIFEIEGPDGVYEVDAPDQGKAVSAFKKMSAPVVEQPSILPDVAKSFLGSGLPRGLALIAGIPGDVQDLARRGINKGIEYGAGKFGYQVPEAIPALRVAAGAPGAYPTSEQLVAGLEKLTA